MKKGTLIFPVTMLILSFGACDSEEKGAADAGGAGDAGAADAGEVEVKLKEKCAYDQLNTPCSSLVTRASGKVIEGGPYGAYVEQNVGQGFEVPVNSAETFCNMIITGFGEDPEISADIADLRDLDLSLYTIFRPANMVKGEKYPIITWGNGTCAQPGGYGALLSYVASYGFVIFAANCRYTAGGAMLKALDFAFAANKDPKSFYYHKLDTTKVGAMGHSQGGGATIAAADDSRVKAVIIFNGGTSATKPFLAVGGDHDINNASPDYYQKGIDNATVSQAAFIYYHKVPVTGNVSGHLTLMLEPERVVDATRAWWQYILQGDQEAAKMFVGADCGLCNQEEDFEFGQKGLK